MSDPSPPVTIPVVAAVIGSPRAPGGEVLLALRPRNKRHGGLWEFPGGKVEHGESEAEALAREMEEELGVGLSGVGELLHVARDPGSRYEIRFVAVEVTGIPRAIEHLELRWVGLEKAAALELAPADRSLINHLMEGGAPRAGHDAPGASVPGTSVSVASEEQEPPACSRSSRDRSNEE